MPTIGVEYTKDRFKATIRNIEFDLDFDFTPGNHKVKVLSRLEKISFEGVFEDGLTCGNKHIERILAESGIFLCNNLRSLTMDYFERVYPTKEKK